MLAALLAAYAAAWLAISQLPLAPALLAVALSGLALWRGLRQQGWLGVPLPQLEVSARGELIAHWPSHAEQVGVRADSLALPWLIVLKLNTQRGRLALLLTVDSAPPTPCAGCGCICAGRSRRPSPDGTLPDIMSQNLTLADWLTRLEALNINSIDLGLDRGPCATPWG